MKINLKKRFTENFRKKQNKFKHKKRLLQLANY